jgi:hypothetical protein
LRPSSSHGKYDEISLVGKFENSLVCEDVLLNTGCCVQEDNCYNQQLRAVDIIEDEGESSMVTGKIGESSDLAGGQASSSLHVMNKGTILQQRSNTDIVNLQATDVDFKPIYDARILNPTERPPLQEISITGSETKHYWLLWASLEIIDGILY